MKRRNPFAWSKVIVGGALPLLGKKTPFPHVSDEPLNIVRRTDRVRDAIKRIARDAVDHPNSCFSKNLHQQIRYLSYPSDNPL